MDYQTLKTHLLDFVKGLAGAMAAAALMAGLNYVGAHIPVVLQFLAGVGTATSTIKGLR